MPRLARSVAVGCTLGLLLGGARASAQSSRPDPPPPADSALAVPFLPQSELLCGGAAVAMVERWWGRRGVYAEDFASLVRPALGGIRTGDLVDAARDRGWQTETVEGDATEFRRRLEQGVPVIALLKVGAGRFHYFVVLRWSAGRVILHDPARGPFRSMPEERFLAAWNGADRWAMTLRPAPPLPSLSRTDPVPAVDSLPCRPWLDLAVDAVAAATFEAADSLLSTAARECPAEPVVLREQAGLRFRQHRLAESTRLARHYLDAAPDDTLGWQLLAASEYLSGHRGRALEAWNRVGRPVIDLVRLDGLKGTRFAVVDEALDLDSGSELTLPDLALARRRVADVPALRRTQVEYHPVGHGRVEVRTVVTERRVLEPAWRLLVAGAVRALAQREIGLTISSPTGGGEVWSAGWRWEEAHPRLGGRVDFPIRLGTPGVIGVSGSWERFRFSLDSATGGVAIESRRSSAVGFGSWITPGFRPSVGLRLEKWSGDRAFLTTLGGVEFRALRDRLTLSATGEYGATLGPARGYTRGSVDAVWASDQGLGRATWSTRLGIDQVSGATPLGLWPVASGNIPWAIPLRAHPRTREGFLPGATTGRGMLHGGLSGDHPVLHAGPVTIAAGLFLDGARILQPASGRTGGQLYLDAGGGLRFGIGDGSLGVLRIDLATGLTDRSTALTAGIHQSWPPFRQDSH